jgi:steroid 5-alpha reductase family enzyme
MFSTVAYWDGLVCIALIALIAWLWSLFRRDVSGVDTLWSLMFLLLASVYARRAPVLSTRAWVVLALVGVWALRLSIYITWRNWGEPEDSRYQTIRRRNEPNFALKSLGIVFGLQAVLAWFISLPLLGAISTPSAMNPLDGCGMVLWLVGMVFEAGGDWQLARFRADAAHRTVVLDKGFWRFTRHPNYFGDFCVWWGFYLFALGAGAWWAIVGPLLMSFLLLRVSGVTLLEKDIGTRRPEYADYVRRTSKFFPWRPAD